MVGIPGLRGLVGWPVRGRGRARLRNGATRWLRVRVFQPRNDLQPSTWLAARASHATTPVSTRLWRASHFLSVLCAVWCVSLSSSHMTVRPGGCMPLHARRATRSLAIPRVPPADDAGAIGYAKACARAHLLLLDAHARSLRLPRLDEALHRIRILLFAAWRTRAHDEQRRNARKGPCKQIQQCKRSAAGQREQSRKRKRGEVAWCSQYARSCCSRRRRAPKLLRGVVVGRGREDIMRRRAARLRRGHVWVLDGGGDHSAEVTLVHPLRHRVRKGGDAGHGRGPLDPTDEGLNVVLCRRC